jgi:hypothetical protein
MKTLMHIAVIVGMNAVAMAADPIPGNDGGKSRQSIFPDKAQTSRFGQTNQIQHGPSTSSGSGMTRVPSSTTNKPSGVTTNIPSSTIDKPSGVLTNPPSSTTDQPTGTNGPKVLIIKP